MDGYLMDKQFIKSGLVAFKCIKIYRVMNTVHCGFA